MTGQEIEEIIKAQLSCDLINVSGDGRHWFATIVSPEFQGLRPIARHQRVYKTLGTRMQTDEVHALSMKTFTPEEWGQQSGSLGDPSSEAKH